ncbi:MAG TPA: TonB family protein [Vicinamibacterales bacterium]|nr:TonB family protein [Vicinamibacterales bacterium]
MLRLLAFVAVAALLAPAPVGAQFQKPIPANDPPPNGQRIEANDGDTIVIRGGARVRVVHRSEGTVRAIYNSGQRWLVILLDFADPNGGPPDGKVDGSYRFDDVDGVWPLGDRWEGSAVIDDYAMAQGNARVGFGLTTNAGFIQLFSPMNSQWFRDPRAAVTLTYRGGGGGTSPSRMSFDEAEQQATQDAARQAEMRANRSLGTPTMGTGAAAGVLAPVRVGGDIAVPIKILDVKPVYPAEAQQARVTGIVIIEATIAPDGTVGDARVLRSIPLLDRAALDAVRHWRFTPTVVSGVAVPVIMTVTVNFSLQ